MEAEGGILNVFYSIESPDYVKLFTTVAYRFLLTMNIICRIQIILTFSAHGFVTVEDCIHVIKSCRAISRVNRSLVEDLTLLVAMRASNLT
jgi:hypothetical protein